MTDWILFLPPLLVLPIVLLFRFVGCAWIAGLESPEAPPAPPAPSEPLPVPQPTPTPAPTPPPDTEKRGAPPRYRDYILGLDTKGDVINNTIVPNGADVVAYWRLIDDPAKPGVFGSDEKGFAPGQAKEDHALPDVEPTNDEPGSEPRDPAHFNLGEDSLIESDPAVHCRFFDGAYVFVPHVPNLFHSQFTIEAWVRVGTLTKGYEHVLFDAGGAYVYPAGTPASPRGFRIVADRTNSWQVYVAPGETALFAKPPLISPNSRAHVALTIADKTPGSTQKIVTFYLNGKPTDVPAEITSYAPPHEAPLFIGIENTRPVPSPTLLTLHHPALFRIQEVVLHRKALSQEELFNHVDINRKVGAA
jgi:hypothetical protein